jgi:hypothetical protein
MFVVGIPILFSSLAGGYYYYSSYPTDAKKLPQLIQDEIKKGRIDNLIPPNECDGKQVEDSEKEKEKGIIKSNINFKIFNLNNKNDQNNKNKSINWNLIFKIINDKKFILTKTSLFNNILNTKNDKQEEIEMKLFNKPIKKYTIRNSSEDPDSKQLYLKEKLVKTFKNTYLHYKLDKLRKIKKREEEMKNTLDRLYKCLETHNIKMTNIKTNFKIKDQQLIAKNNEIKEKNKLLKFPKKNKKDKKHNINQPIKNKTN